MLESPKDSRNNLTVSEKHNVAQLRQSIKSSEDLILSPFSPK